MTATSLYRSNLQKGGAMLEDTSHFVRNWIPEMPVRENLERAVDASGAGGRSSLRRADLVSRILKPRFVDPGVEVLCGLRVLLDDDAHAFRDACYFETTRTEAILADFVEGPLFDWYQEGRSEITADDAKKWLERQKVDGLAPPWSEAVTRRVGRTIVSTLRDFGVLEGATRSTRKQIGAPYPSIAGFAYVCWRLAELGVTAAKLQTSPVWRRWLLQPSDVGDLLADLASHGVIHLNRAGSVTRIEWRGSSLAEVVHVAA